MDTKDLVLHSHKLFARGEYEESLKLLKFLAQKYPNDSKIKHNIVVVEYYMSNLTKSDNFVTFAKDHVNMSLENLDRKHFYYCYNYAVTLYYMKQYNQALLLIEKLLQNIFLLNDSLILQVLLLSVELNLKLYEPYKSYEVILLLESFMGIKNDNLTHYYINTMAYNNAAKKKFQIPDRYVNVYTNIIHQYKISCLIMSKNFIKYKKYQALGARQPATNYLNQDMYIFSEFDFLSCDFKSAIGKLTMAHNTKLFQKISEDPIEKCLMNNTIYSQYLTTCYYNNLALIHLSMNKPNLSVFYSRKALTENENLLGDFPDHDSTNESSFTNFNASSNTTTSAVVPKTFNCGKNILIFAYDMRHQLMYNLGIHLLHAKKPLPAFDCLIEILQIYHSNPRIWLRIAECCIQAVKGGNEENFTLKKKLHSAVQHIMGYGIHRKTILIPNNSHHKTQENYYSPSMPSATLEFATVCLKNSLILIDELLCNESLTTFGKEQLYKMPLSNPISKEELYSLKSSVLSCATYIQLSLNEYYLAYEYGSDLLKLLSLRGGSIITNYMAHIYVAECLILKDCVGEGLQYLHFHDSILHIPYVQKCLQKLPIFGNGSNQTSESVENLDSDDNRDNINFRWNLVPITKVTRSLGQDMFKSTTHFTNILPIKSESVENLKLPFNWIPQDLPSAKLIMHYNLCVGYTLLGEYEKASHMLRNNIPFKTPNDLPSQFIALALYLAIKQGHIDVARRIILQNYSQIQH